MANAETQQLDSIISSRRAMLAVGGAALASLAFAPKAQAATISDSDILNFALNLEYLEAQFYCLAVHGVTIDQGPQAIPLAPNPSLGAAGTVTVKPNFTPVTFSDTAIAAYAAETSTEEGKHVLFLQNALSTAAVSMPNIDLYNSFLTLGGLVGAPTFDPFTVDAYFLLGAFIFEDTGVSAYHGAATLISDKTNILPPALGIHAVEAYHAGLVRTSINRLDAGSDSLNSITRAIAGVRTTLAGGGSTANSPFDTGIGTVQVPLNGSNSVSATTIVDADISSTGLSIAAGRTTTQILQIVTGMTTAPTTSSSGVTGKYSGVFFPSGLNGLIS